MAAPRFGKTRCRNIWASADNPRRDGLFVEIKRRRTGMNRGTFYRLTDGNGDFWELPPASLVAWDDGDTEETVECKAVTKMASERSRRGLEGPVDAAVVTK